MSGRIGCRPALKGPWRREQQYQHTSNKKDSSNQADDQADARTDCSTNGCTYENKEERSEWQLEMFESLQARLVSTLATADRNRRNLTKTVLTWLQIRTFFRHIF